MKGPITRTRLGIVVAGLVFLIMVLIGEFEPLLDLFPTNGITRTDVQKYRVHVLNTPSMEKFENKLSGMNITANLSQLGTSNVFRAEDKHNHHAYFRLNDQYEFEEIKIGGDGSFPSGISAPPYFSFKNDEGGIVVLKNDVEKAHLPLDGLADDEKTSFRLKDNAPLIINYGKSAVVYEEGRAEPSCLYIADLDKPTLSPIQEIKNIKQATADLYGKQFYAITRPVKSLDKTDRNSKAVERNEDPNDHLQHGPSNEDEIRISGANLDVKPPVVAQFKPAIEMKTLLYYSAPARALILIDREKLRLLDSSRGEPIAILHHKDLFEQFGGPQQEQTDPFLLDENGLKIEGARLPKFSILPGVPAAIFGDKLIDLRSGEVVDSLFGYTPKSVFAVDYANKKLYYSTNDSSTATGSASTAPPATSAASDANVDPNAMMCVNVYDLHEVAFQFRITLGSRSIVEDEELKRNDYIKQLFIGQHGKLIAISAPDE